MMKLETLKEKLKDLFKLTDQQIVLAAGELTLEVANDKLHKSCKILCKEFKFSQLIDLCGVDYLYFGKGEWETYGATTQGFSRGVSLLDTQENIQELSANRFAVVYHLLSIKHNQRLRIKSFVDTQEPIIQTVTDIWPVANWYERETFDLYGILFAGHPDLRRILTDYGFVGHPMRKDFPLSGNVEVRYCPDKKRVIYQEVSIPPRVLVPKVIRHTLPPGEQ